MGLEGRRVWISRGVRGPGFAFFHKEVAASPPQLGLGATLRWLGVSLGKEVVGRDWEWGKPVSTQ